MPNLSRKLEKAVFVKKHSGEEYSLLDKTNPKTPAFLLLLGAFCCLQGKEQMSIGKDGCYTYGTSRKTNKIATKSDTSKAEKLWKTWAAWMH